MAKSVSDASLIYAIPVFTLYYNQTKNYLQYTVSGGAVPVDKK